LHLYNNIEIIEYNGFNIIIQMQLSHELCTPEADGHYATPSSSGEPGGEAPYLSYQMIYNINYNF